MKQFHHIVLLAAWLFSGCGGGGGGGGAGAPEAVAGIPRNAVYEIAITGGVSVLADLVVLPTVAQPGPPLTNNGVNAVDIAIFTRGSPIAGLAGALWFATNTSLSSLRGSNLAASNIDIAFVDVDPATASVLVTVDGNAFGLPNARLATLNIYNVTTGVAAQIHNVLAGQIAMQFVDGGQAVVGEIALGGSSGFSGPGISSQYRATFTGVRID